MNTKFYIPELLKCFINSVFSQVSSFEDKIFMQLEIDKTMGNFYNLTSTSTFILTIDTMSPTYGKYMD